jgi:hypothetical protein
MALLPIDDRAAFDMRAAPPRPGGWAIVVTLAQLVIIVLMLLLTFARDSVRYWLRQADGPVITYRWADKGRRRS